MSPEKNQLSQATSRVSELKHFPYKDFKSFLAAYEQKKISIGLPMDHARMLVSGGYVGNIWAKLSVYSCFTPLLSALFYLLWGFISGDYWILIMLIWVPATFVIGNPMVMRVGISSKVCVAFAFFCLIFQSLIEKFPGFEYWVPILVGAAGIYLIYAFAERAVLAQGLEDEEWLCLLWRKMDLKVYDEKHEKIYAQDHLVEDGKFSIYDDDVKKEWEAHMRRWNL